MTKSVAEVAVPIKQALTDQSSAFGLVCACLSPRMVALPSVEGFDPDLLARVARRHQVSGLVAARMGRAGLAVPDALERQARAARHRALRQLALTLDLADALARAEIPAVFVKGLTLSQRAFGSPLARAAVDIDLLIGTDQVELAWQVLESAGLVRVVPAKPITGSRLAMYCLASKDSIHVHSASRQTVELHWRLADELSQPKRPPPCELEAIELAPGRSVPVLNAEAQFLFLCTHGAAHGWARLKWLADVAALLHQSTDGGSALWHHAQEQGGAIAASSAIRLAADLFGLEPPPGFVAPRSMRLRLLLWIARRTITAGEGARELEATRWRGWTEMLAKLLVAANWRGRLAVFRRLVLAGEDVAAVPLPAALFWHYPVLRVPLLIRRRLLRARQLHAQSAALNTTR